MHVVFRADATSAIGTGHVMRCWALAEVLQENGWDVSWHGTINVPWVATLIAEQGWPIRPILSREGDPTASSEADLMVVDSYGNTAPYRQAALDRGIAVLAIVDHHHADLGPGDLWVNPGPPMDAAGSPNFLNGPDYVLIRRNIRALASARKTYAPGSGLTVLLGGADSLGLARTVEDLDIGERLVAGPGEGHAGRIAWHPAGLDLLRAATRSRLVVSAAGVSSWEMLHIGVPLGLVLATENQRGNYEWITGQGWADGLGDGRDLPDRVQETLRRAEEGLLVGKQRIDGLGAERVVEVVLGRS